MNKLKRIVLLAFIVAALLMAMLPAQAFAKEKELYVTANEIYLKSGLTHMLATDFGGDDLFYISSDPRVATVDSDGCITAISEGTTTIFIRNMSGTGLNRCEVFVDMEPEVIEEVEIPKTHFYQADNKWKFSAFVRSRACVLTSVSMLLKNSGIETDPADTYLRNGKRRIGYQKVLNYYEMQYDCAVPYSSEYLQEYSSRNGMTKIIDPAENYDDAIIEALERHPEGVLCYFVNGHGRHAIVATSVENGVVYYNDPGRPAANGEHVPFEETWCAYHHNMSTGDLAYMLAIS